ncbi:MAG TPA: hypothetical protein VFZ34_10110 [Blastocatellia bacterium]|nr:hypothetical protein [Blastocatellia bacterium]
MNVYLQKLRGVIGISLLWTVIWTALFQIFINLLALFLPPDSDVGTLRLMLITAWVGFVSGVLFGLLFAIAENRRAIRDLSLGRAALWGMLATAVFPLLTGRADQTFWTCPFGAIIAVVLIALARKAAPRESQQPQRLRDVFFASVLAPVRDAVNPAAVRLLLLTLVLLLTACGNNRPFDSAAWLQADARTRGRMCEDLIARKLLVRQSVAEAQRMLGAPDKEYPSVLVYSIDMGLPFKDPKHYGLQVHLDEHRNVREVRIVD